jgi:hypothetical protein
MSEQRPDFQDAELVLRLYELRREPLMRQARDALNGKFWPKSYDEIAAVMTDMQHPLNAAWRQVTSYWEMFYSFAHHGICNADFLVDANGGEGIFFYSRLVPFLAEIRKNSSPTAFQHTEWITTHCQKGKERLALMRSRVEAIMSKMK